MMEWVSTIIFDNAALLKGPTRRIVAEALGRDHIAANKQRCETHWYQIDLLHIIHSGMFLRITP